MMATVQQCLMVVRYPILKQPCAQFVNLAICCWPILHVDNSWWLRIVSYYRQIPTLLTSVRYVLTASTPHLTHARESHPDAMVTTRTQVRVLRVLESFSLAKGNALTPIVWGNLYHRWISVTCVRMGLCSRTGCVGLMIAIVLLRWMIHVSNVLRGTNFRYRKTLVFWIHSIIPLLLLGHRHRLQQQNPLLIVHPLHPQPQITRYKIVCSKTLWIPKCVYNAKSHTN